MNHRMMSDEHNIVGRWPSNHQWQFPADLSPHHQQQSNTTLSPHVQNLVPHHNMSNYQVAELSWENGQPAIQGIFSAKPTWERSSSSHDTLESIVHQAKSLNHKTNMINSHDQRQEEAFAGNVEIAASLSKKRPRSETTTLDDCGGRCSIKSRWVHDHGNVAAAGECSGYGSGGATFRKGNETDYTSSSMRGASWVSLDSPRSLITKTSFEDSACRKNREERQETEEGTVRSHGTRRRRFADVHNESERRRRDRINQKLKALQKLVPNASKESLDKSIENDQLIHLLLSHCTQPDREEDRPLLLLT